MNGIAYSYIRFSSAEQAKGRSLARQREACERYCLEHGLNLATQVDYSFLDSGASAYKGEHLGERGQLARFLSLVQSGDIESGSTLIVESLDRLSRQHVRAALTQLLQLIEAGIRIVTLSDGRLYDADCSAEDLILSIFVMSRAHEESTTKAVRARDAMQKKQELARSEGRPMGNIAPLWLRYDGEKYIEIPEKVAIVRSVFEMAIEGRGKGQTAKILNEQGKPSFKGRTWGPSSVDKLLKNRAVMGEYIPYSVQSSVSGKRESLAPIADYFPKIVDETTFHAANNAGRMRLVSHATKQSTTFNVWQGIAKCGSCGTAMHIIDKGRPPKGNKYLQCYSARKGLCKTGLFRLDRLESVLLALLVQVDSLALVKESGKSTAKALASIQNQIETLRLEFEELKVALREKRSVALASMVQDAETRLGQLEIEQENLKGEMASENGMGFDAFMSSLEVNLRQYEGRSRANALLHRLKITVQFGTEDFLVVQEGKHKAAAVSIAIVDGITGYLMGPRHPLVEREFVPATNSALSEYGRREDRYYEWLDKQENDGSPAGEY